MIGGDIFRCHVIRFARELGWDPDNLHADYFEISERAPDALEFIKARVTELEARLMSEEKQTEQARTRVVQMQGLCKSYEARVAELEKERGECLSEMRDCELDVSSPLDGFREAARAIRAEISCSSELRAHVAEYAAVIANDLSARITELEAEKLCIIAELKGAVSRVKELEAEKLRR